MFCLGDKLLHLHHHQATLRVFRSKISELILMPASWFDNCFQMVHAAELVAEIEYPMAQWGAAAIDEYLSYSLSLMDLLNSISSSVSHLQLLKVSLLRDANSPNSAAKDVEKCGEGRNRGGSLNVEGLRPGSQKKESVILEALMELKEVVVSSLSLVVAGLSAATVSAGKCGGAAGEVRQKLEMVESAILGINKQANDLFSEELASRNELLNYVRFQM